MDAEAREAWRRKVEEDFLRQNGLTHDELRALGAGELVERAIAKPQLFKAVTKEFRRRGPVVHDGAAEECLIRAHAERRAHGWLTAALLPLVASRRGYDLALEILLEGPGLLAESYATQAMSSIDVARARADFLRIISDVRRHPRVRYYAGDALKRVSDLTIVPTIIEAVRARRLGVARASAVLRTLAFSTSQLVDWLQDADIAVTRVGFAVAVHRNDMDQRLATAMNGALQAGRIELSPMERAKAEGRIAEPTRA